MCENEPEVVVLATKIMARLIVVHGSTYSKKFAEKSGGYTLMQHRLKLWWKVSSLWPICFAVLLGMDVAAINTNKPFDRFELLQLLLPRREPHILFPEMLTVIMEMLRSGLKQSVSAVEDTNNSLLENLRSLPRPSMSSCFPVGKSLQQH